MGSWAMCSPQGSGNGLSLEVRVSSALCRWWGLKTLFRFCEQWPLPDWAVNHLVPANTVPTSWSYELTQGSPGAQAVKNLWQCRRLRIDPWVGNIPWRREWQPTAAVLTRESHGQRSLLGYSPWKHREGHNWGLNHIKKQSHYFVNRGPSSQGYGFSSGRVWMWELDYKESWVSKNWCFWTVVLEKTLESPLDCKEIQPVHPKGNQSWIFIHGRPDAEAETPILWLPHAKSWLIWKDPDAGKDWGQEEKGMTEDEMAGWHHRLDGDEQAPGDSWGHRNLARQGRLACCSPRGHKESDMTERLNWTELMQLAFLVIQSLRNISAGIIRICLFLVLAHGVLQFLSMRLREWNTSSFLCHEYDVF